MDQEQDEGRRKSKRQRTPNSYYTTGINQTKKIQSKKNRIEGDDQYSSQEDKNASNNARNYQQGHYEKQRYNSPWLACIMPNNKQIKVQIVFESSQSPQIQPLKTKEDYSLLKQTLSYVEAQSSVVSNCNGNLQKKLEQSGSLNLLSLFQKVIRNVSDQAPTPVKNSLYQSQPGFYHSGSLDELGLKAQVSNQKNSKSSILTPPPKRVVEQDHDGRILSLNVDRLKKQIQIKHSKIGECTVPIEVAPQSWTKEEQFSEQDTQLLEDFKKKLLMNSSILKDISIFS